VFGFCSGDREFGRSSTNGGEYQRLCVKPPRQAGMVIHVKNASHVGVFIVECIIGQDAGSRAAGIEIYLHIA